MTTPRTCRLETLGCKVNQYETQYVKEALEASGYQEAAPASPLPPPSSTSSSSPPTSRS